MPRLSIIIPAKNEEENLPKLLSSIKEQTFTDYEVIVADAHSTDRTRDLASAWGARVVEGGMPGEGRNKGALKAQGELLLFLDADVILSSHHFLRDIVLEFDEELADVATCRLSPMSKRPIDKMFHGAYNAFAQATERIRPHAPGLCILVRRHAHEGMQGFDEDVVFAEDHEYVQRAHRLGHRFKLLKSHPIKTSVRRFDRDGRWGIAIKYLFAEVRMVTRGPFKKMPFKYEMGGRKKN